MKTKKNTSGNNISFSNIKRNGFTLIEQLVAVSILALVLVTGSRLFFTTLQSKTKLESMSVLKQTGEYSLIVMSNLLKNAQGITSCEESNSIEFTNSDGGITTLTCDESLGTISSNSAILISDYVTGCNGGAAFICNNTVEGKPPTVEINFTLTRGSVADILGHYSQEFKTMVSLRTY